MADQTHQRASGLASSERRRDWIGDSKHRRAEAAQQAHTLSTSVRFWPVL